MAKNEVVEHIDQDESFLKNPFVATALAMVLLGLLGFGGIMGYHYVHKAEAEALEKAHAPETSQPEVKVVVSSSTS